MKIAACVILYHPKEKDLKNIISYLTKVDKLYIYDNTENTKTKLDFEDYNKSIYTSDFENKGLSFRLNQACQQAIADGYNYLMTMDQDSYFSSENLNYYFDSIKNYPDKASVGIFGLDYSTKNIIANLIDIVPLEVHSLITSGSVINLDNYNEIGGFDENLFIDGVDFDYCFATLKKGFKCILFKNNYLNHSCGVKIKTASIKTLYLLKKEKLLHSHLRIYYIIRNMLYLEKKYGLLFPNYIQERKKRYSSQVFTNMIYSKNIFVMLKYRFKAINDFKKNKMGKIEL